MVHDDADNLSNLACSWTHEMQFSVGQCNEVARKEKMVPSIIYRLMASFRLLNYG